MLAIAPHFAPVETTEVGADPQRAWVIVENWTTYKTVAWVARRCGWSGTVLWGAGNQVAARLGAAADQLAPPEELRYFGDIDLVGLRLARDLERTAADLQLPASRPARGLYQLLLEAGEPVRGRSRTVPVSLATWLFDWFGDASLSAAAIAVAEVGRLPQEAVGRRLLAERDLTELLE